MIDDWLLSLVYAFCLVATTMPLAFMFGSPCTPLCGECQVCDGLLRTHPRNEGTWVPSGTWQGGANNFSNVTWTFVENPGDESGETWFFYGAASSSRRGGGATLEEQRDWGNLCNWYSNKTTSPSQVGTGLGSSLNRRATTLPPNDAVVHIYTGANTANTGPVTVKTAYFWGMTTSSQQGLIAGSELTATTPAHDSLGCVVFNNSTRNQTSATINGGATFSSSGFSARSQNRGTVNGGAVFGTICENFLGVVNGGATFFESHNTGGTINGGAVFNGGGNRVTGSTQGTVNGGAVFNGGSFSTGLSATINGGAIFNGTSTGPGGVVNDGAVFNDSAGGGGTVNGGAEFNQASEWISGAVNDGAVFNDSSRNRSSTGVFSGATFNDSSTNLTTVNDGAEFNDNAVNDGGTVNGGATFNGNALNANFGTVNGGATFNDAACSTRFRGTFGACPGVGKREFVTHPTDVPTCNGTAPDGCVNVLDTCGCG
jgi:hypothetical protein